MIFLLLPSLAFGKETGLEKEEKVPDRSKEKLLQVMRKSEDSWDAAKIPFWERNEKRREVVGKWSLAEIQSVCWDESAIDWNDVLFRSWGGRDPEKALAFVFGLEKKYAEEYLKAAKSLEGGPGEATVQEIGMNLNAVLAGWSSVDPRAAWKAVSDPAGKIWNSEAFDGYGYLAPKEIFTYLPIKDPEFAINEFVKQTNDLFRGSMLKGMSKGLPDGYDWKTFFEKILNSPRSEHREVLAPLRGSLMGRWLADDAVAAEKWFRSKGGERVSKKKLVEYDETGKVVRTRLEDLSLAQAARHWLARKPKSATAWIQKRTELLPEILKGTNWLDEDQLDSVALRKLMLTCLDQAGREEILEGYLKVDDDVFFDEITPSHDRTELMLEVAGLKVSQKLSDRIFKKLWERRNWDRGE